MAAVVAELEVDGEQLAGDDARVSDDDRVAVDLGAEALNGLRRNWLGDVYTLAGGGLVLHTQAAAGRAGVDDGNDEAQSGVVVVADGKNVAHLEVADLGPDAIAGVVVVERCRWRYERTTGGAH